MFDKERNVYITLRTNVRIPFANEIPFARCEREIKIKENTRKYKKR